MQSLTRYALTRKLTINMKHILILSLCITLISACDTKRKNDEPVAGSADSLNLALKSSIEESIVPAISAFKTETETLQTNATTFCSNIDQTNLETLQDQWKALSLQWNQIVMFNIGPLDDDIIFPKMNFIESMRQRGTDNTGVVRGEIVARLGDITPLDESYFNSLSFTRVGMLALEVLIFEDSISNDNSDLSKIVTDYQGNSRKCDYLDGMIQLQSRLAAIIENGWLIDFASSGKAFKDTLINGELDDGAESVPALITVIQEHLDYLKKRKLEVVLDAQIADYFYENVTATLDQVEAFLEGATEDSYSFFDQMLSNDFASEVAIVRANLSAARQAIATENRSELATAIGLLDGNFKREIPDSLNVTLGLNFTDGD